MKRTKTERGFRLYSFTDAYGEKCSLQASSSAEESRIWLGIDEAKPMVLSSAHRELPGDGTGWVPFPIPSDASVASRMHLTQRQVKDLLPKLIAFAKTGELP